MRRLRRKLAATVVAVATIVAAAAATPAPATAQVPADLPPGFTDGEPVGGTEGPEPRPPEASPDADPDAPIAGDATRRHFGRQPWQAIQAAAAATPRSCGLTDNGLVALTVSPVFKESSAATTAATAPSPMTLSRYDEWTGTRNGDTNRNANYGLYAFRDPNTPYKRAFWHPGIGIWQYDSAGVGAPFTAIERMDVGTVAADVAKGMAARYCNPSPSIVGHGPPYTDLERRYSAWWPWTYPCTVCEKQFQDLTSTTPDFQNVTLVDGISTTGGAVRRTCALDGVAGTVPCWYVDARVGVVQGATAWATIDPSGGSSTVAPTPLAEAFYVVDRGATEERHWLRADTGYGIDISGSRQIGLNERPRSNQAGSGVTWRSSSGLCDLTMGRGACVPQPPAGVSSTTTAINGTYRTIPLDAQGDGLGDVLFYAPGTSPDVLWSGQGRGTFRSSSVAINGSYDDVLPLDVDDDGDDDVLFYRRSTGAAVLWLANGNGTFTSKPLTVRAGLRPVVVDTDGDQRDEVFWYGPGSAPDARWSWDGRAFRSTAMPVSGLFIPFAGDFDGDGRSDIWWYAPGSAPDFVWYFTGATTKVSASRPISGSYVPMVGDYDGDGRDDVFWYAPGSAGDTVQFGNAGRTITPRAVRVDGSFQPVVADLEGDGRDDVVWHRPGSGADSWWRWSTSRAVTSAGLRLDGQHRALVGAYSAGGADGVLWYAPGALPDAVWWR